MRAGASTVTVWALPLLILAAACLVIVTDPGGIAARLRGLEFDAYQHARPRPAEDTGQRAGHAVRVLDADAASVARFGHWP
jgi:CHASE2 domain-containing sensor protein